MKKMRSMIFVLAFSLLLASCGKTGGQNIVKPEDGYAEGGMGDAMRTSFFDYSVNSAYLCSSLAGYVPADGNELLVAEITVTNTFGSDIEMYDTDFQAQWDGEGDDEYSYPITFGPEGESLDTVEDNQLPAIYTLADKESRTGLLIFEVPTGNSRFSVSYMEYFDNDTTGDTFFVFFDASQAQTAA